MTKEFYTRMGYKIAVQRRTICTDFWLLTAFCYDARSPPITRLHCLFASICNLVLLVLRFEGSTWLISLLHLCQALALVFAFEMTTSYFVKLRPTRKVMNVSVRETFEAFGNNLQCKIDDLTGEDPAFVFQYQSRSSTRQSSRILTFPTPSADRQARRHRY
jgi:hypothetical protein